MMIKIWSDCGDGSGDWDAESEFWLALDGDKKHVQLCFGEKYQWTFDVDELLAAAETIKKFSNLED